MRLRTPSRAQRGVCLSTSLILTWALCAACGTGTGFVWSVTPEFRTLQPGGSATFTVNIASKEDIDSQVRLSVTGLPDGATARDMPRTLASTASEAEIVIDVAADVELGTYSFTFVAEELGFNDRRSDHLLLVTTGGTGPDFTLEVDPQEHTFTDGFAKTFSFYIRPLNDFTGVVNISLGALPADLELRQDVTPASLTFGPGQGGTFVIGWSGPAARQVTEDGEVIVTATSGALSHSRTITLHWPANTTPDFELELEPAEVTFNGPNTVQSITYTARPLNGFTGTVTISLGASPDGFEAFNLDPASVTIGPTDSASGTFDVYWHGTAGPATVDLAVTGTAGTTTHAATLTIHRPGG